ncbi:NAD-dependent succinate-semialdehyde dehydrogenase [Oricola indica]|uniref:NAD-dependent succinate-semialdehyde dehydrogenase n=1 Tax=Oricola indica TaxID=2872591 RepID=UPI003CCBD3D5
MSNDYPAPGLFIAGEWIRSGRPEALPVLNPATEEQIGLLPVATTDDLSRAVASTRRGFEAWSRVSGFDRGQVLRKAAALMRERAESIARAMTLEHGKPLTEARQEANAAADIIEWFAEEARRTYGRQIPARLPGVMQVVFKQPIGPVAAFSPWNFPINQATRKIAAAVAAGCSIILKGPEETPASCCGLVAAFIDAGLPPDVVNLVFGHPAEISEYLIAHPVIRKISFTGSTAVGRRLSEIAGRHLKRTTMELGGHAPVLIFADADLERAVQVLVAAKYRNAGQICISPTRFLVAAEVMEEFTARFVAGVKALKVGDGLDEGTQVGPLAHDRRVTALEALIADAAQKGARVECGGNRLGNRGFFFAPTVLSGVTPAMRIMNEEPFGPVALLASFNTEEEALAEANRLDVGLGAYAFTRSSRNASRAINGIESGMVSVNHQGLVFPELPFGGIGDSGDGKEGGTEAMEPYLITRFSTHLTE